MIADGGDRDRGGLPEQPDVETAAEPGAGVGMTQDELITMLVHELRGPLTLARGHLDVLRRNLRRAGQQEMAQDAEQIAHALERLGAMITDLLDTARLERGLFAVTLRRVDLVQLVRQTVTPFQSPRTPIRVEAPATLLAERADSDQLERILNNLLRNASEHTPDGTPVTVRVTQELRAGRAWARVSVCDDGPGIAPSVVPLLGQRYVRGPTSRGLGLGLSLVRDIVEAHGGVLTVESHPGLGTSVHVSLPLDDPHGGA